MQSDTAAARRAALVLLLPLAAGACAPWASWLVVGHLGDEALAVAMFGMAVTYLTCVQRLGDREAVLRRKLGRRYEPPPPDMALAVCLGLAASFLVPGLSAGALAGAVGFPRLGGTVDAYLPAELERTGARIELSRDAMPPGSRLDLLPDGDARIAVPRFGRPVEFGLPWRAEGAQICLDRWCLTVDPASGRLRVPSPGGTELGRVAAIGAAARIPALRSGAPWEIGNLFGAAGAPR